MNKTLSKVFIFVGGVVLGSAVTWKLTKTKYERIADEEIASVKEVYARHEKQTSENDICKEESDDNNADESDSETDGIQYRKIIRDGGYTNYTTPSKKEEDKEVDKSKYDKPYVIRPEEFDELVGYRAITLKYFADGTLMYDDDDEPIDDIEDVIGEDALDYFGEYVDDAVYVRDDERKIDYEILLDMRTYAEYLNSSPTYHGE